VLTDPQAVTISGTASSLPRLEERSETNVYSDRTNNVDLYVTQKVDKKTGIQRSTTSLVKSTIVTDPVTGLNAKVPYSISVSSMAPIGITAAQTEALYDALTTALEASTKALLKKILGGER
jgi:hypothetical protein